MMMMILTLNVWSGLRGKGSTRSLVSGLSIVTHQL